MAKGYLGPAAQSFLSNELHAMGVNANTVTDQHVAVLIGRVRDRATRVMGEQKADELAKALSGCQKANAPTKSGHKLASDAAARLLSTGKLRQAEKAYRELVDKHGDYGSYVGLARTMAALEDEPAALVILRDAAAIFARNGDRANAVSLLAEAVAVSPGDLSAHRRLAAALANQGDLPGAVEEYARFVDAAMSTGDSRRALLELAYGRETLGDLPGLLALVDRIQSPGKQASPTPTPLPRIDAPRPPSRQAPRTLPSQNPSTHKAVPPQLSPLPAKELPEAPAAPAVVLKNLAAKTNANATQTAVVLEGARTVTHAEKVDLEAPVDVLARAGVLHARTEPRPTRPARPAMDIEPLLKSLTPTGSGVDAAAMAASRAALLTSARDARATDASLDAARRLMALGKLQSASDVLLDLIGHGFTDREAQRLLIEVDCALGRRDVAKEKCGLLGQAYRLDGRADVADDVERLARIL